MVQMPFYKRRGFKLDFLDFTNLLHLKSLYKQKKLKPEKNVMWMTKD